MKSSGSLRFFGDKVINRKLAQYDQICQSMKTVDANEAGIYSEVRKARALIFAFEYNEAANRVFSSRKRPGFQTRVESFIKSDPPLLSYDKTKFNQYVEMVRSRFLSSKVANADTLLHRATELMGLLNKKYNFDNE
jgi:hypothetical protein